MGKTRREFDVKTPPGNEQASQHSCWQQLSFQCCANTFSFSALWRRWQKGMAPQIICRRMHLPNKTITKFCQTSRLKIFRTYRTAHPSGEKNNSLEQELTLQANVPTWRWTASPNLQVLDEHAEDTQQIGNVS